MKHLVAILFFYLCNACALFAITDPYEAMPMPIDESAEPLINDEIKSINDPVTPTLYGGREIKQGELPFSIYIGNCTASIIGKRVILTAGHCRSTGDSATFTLNSVRYSGKCTQHPDYSKGRWLNNDFALCLMDKDIEVKTMAFLNKTTVSKGDTVIMQGYGRGSAGGRLNVGRTKVVRADDMEYTTDDSVVLGGGDSGGGFLKDTADLVNGPFYVIGINSRAGGKMSLFNRTDLDRSQEFFRDWEAKTGAKICGLGDSCKKDTPNPPNPPNPPEPPTPPPAPEVCQEEQQFKAFAERKVVFFNNMLSKCLVDLK